VVVVVVSGTVVSGATVVVVALGRGGTVRGGTDCGVT
jgi:hypothetical protein